jgi:cobalt-zinc-cadmium efflux system protein
MQFTPAGIDIEEINSRVTAIKGVKNLHHVHVWQLDEKTTLFEAHIDLTNDINITGFQEILNRIEVVLHDFGIFHFNIQPEFNRNDSKEIIVQSE